MTLFTEQQMAEVVEAMKHAQWQAERSGENQHDAMSAALTAALPAIERAVLDGIGAEMADRQWCEGMKTAAAMVDNHVYGLVTWPASEQDKYRAALREIDRRVAVAQAAIVESRKSRRALTDEVK